MTGQVEITKARALYFKQVCEFAEAYIDMYNIKAKGAEHAIKDILDVVEWILDKPTNDGRC